MCIRDRGLLIYAVINSLNDFYLGRVSDKTNVERCGGRRLIYIKWGVLYGLLYFSPCGFPAIVRFFAMLGMIIFPLHGQYLVDMSKKLREIHEEKKSAFSQT